MILWYCSRFVLFCLYKICSTENGDLLLYFSHHTHLFFFLVYLWLIFSCYCKSFYCLLFFCDIGSHFCCDIIIIKYYMVKEFCLHVRVFTMFYFHCRQWGFYIQCWKRDSSIHLHFNVQIKIYQHIFDLLSIWILRFSMKELFLLVMQITKLSNSNYPKSYI